MPVHTITAEEVRIATESRLRLEMNGACRSKSQADDRPLPSLLLVSATMASLFSGSVLGNHSKLVEGECSLNRRGRANSPAVGPLFLPHRFTSLRITRRYSSLLGNPFSMTIAGATLAVLVGSLTYPS